MHIWLMALEDEEGLPPILIQKAKSLLSEDEIQRAERFMFERDRNRFVLAHALCRLMLSEYGGYAAKRWRFDKEEFGRPFVVKEMNTQGLDFNLSHTKGMIGCAMAFNCRVGFDLESVSRKVEIEMLAKKQFSHMEYAQLTDLNDAEKPQRFFQLWTLKEAYIKLTGKGLREPLNGFGFDLSDAAPKLHINDRRCAEYEFGLFDVSSSHQIAWARECSDTSMDIETKKFDLDTFSALL